MAKRVSEDYVYTKGEGGGRTTMHGGSWQAAAASCVAPRQARIKNDTEGGRPSGRRIRRGSRASARAGAAPRRVRALPSGRHHGAGVR
eukprot:364811-Chlamydomonas_euryale.AAC.2